MLLKISRLQTLIFVKLWSSWQSSNSDFQINSDIRFCTLNKLDTRDIIKYVTSRYNHALMFHQARFSAIIFGELIIRFVELLLSSLTLHAHPPSTTFHHYLFCEMYSIGYGGQHCVIKPQKYWWSVRLTLFVLFCRIMFNSLRSLDWPRQTGELRYALLARGTHFPPIMS